MLTRLLDESTRKNYFVQIDVFDPAVEGEGWKCPFCDPSSDVYSLLIPHSEDTARMKIVKGLIRAHLTLHKEDLLHQLYENNKTEYEKSRVERLKDVRTWITGTIHDQKLYKENPL